jgi:hypothetical protein
MNGEHFLKFIIKHCQSLVTETFIIVNLSRKNERFTVIKYS